MKLSLDLPGILLAGGQLGAGYLINTIKQAANSLNIQTAKVQ